MAHAEEVQAALGGLQPKALSQERVVPDEEDGDKSENDSAEDDVNEDEAEEAPKKRVKKTELI